MSFCAFGQSEKLRLADFSSEISLPSNPAIHPEPNI